MFGEATNVWGVKKMFGEARNVWVKFFFQTNFLSFTLNYAKLDKI